MAEQARAVGEIAQASQNVARQVGLVTRANKQQSASASSVLDTLTEMKRLGATASRGAQDTGVLAATLVERTRALGDIALEH